MEVYQLDSEYKARKEITKDVIEEVKKDITDAATNIRCNKENCSKCHLNYLCLGKQEKKQLLV